MLLFASPKHKLKEYITFYAQISTNYYDRYPSDCYRPIQRCLSKSDNKVITVLIFGFTRAIQQKRVNVRKTTKITTNSLQ